MTSHASYYHRRYALWLENESGLDRMISAGRLEKNWDKPSDLPAVSVSTRLGDGLFCLYAGDFARGKVFLNRAVRNADRLISEERYLDTDVAEAGHPRNLAEIFRGRAYANWLSGEPLDRRELRRTAEHFVTWCRSKTEDRRSFNGTITMSFYLEAIRAAMIACDLDYAGKLLKAKDRFRWHHAREFDLWRRLVAMYPEVTDEFDEEFGAFFDTVRDPDFQDMVDGLPVFLDRDILALETGIIREMYIVRASPLDPVDPQAVIQAVAR